MFSSNTSQVSSGGYEIQRSLRFNGPDSAYLNRTPGSASNRKTWTWSGWVKRGIVGSGTQEVFIGSTSTGGNSIFTGIRFIDDNFYIQDVTQGTYNIWWSTSAVYRDPAAWYHIVVKYDTTQSSSSNAATLWVNGVQQILTFTANTGAYVQNRDGFINATNNHYIGASLQSSGSGTQNYYNGYMTEINFIDGQALTPSSFGAFDAQTGAWGPTRYAGSYGTNGFYLNFSDNSNTTAATLGRDYSGNSNNWTPNNFSVSAGVGNDSLVDVPTNWGTDTGVGGSVRGNYATLNPLDKSANAGAVNGNLDATSTGGSWVGIRATFGMQTGKWYCEYTPTSGTFHIVSVSQPQAPTTAYIIDSPFAWGYQWDGQKVTNSVLTSYGSGWGVGDIIGIAFDADAGTITFYKNNVSQGVAFSGLTSGPYIVGLGIYPTATGTFNFGQRPFAYTAPSGFKALNTQNLPTPTIGATTATQAGKFFNPVLYTGNGFPTSGTQSVSGVGFQPDWVWIKSRSAAGGNTVTDVVRGINSQLLTNTTGAQETNTDNITALNSDGFSLGSNTTGSTSVNVNGHAYVAWNWRANGTGVTNTAGSITSTVSANTTSGFSIATFTGNGTAGATFGHGLGVAPRMIIIKSIGNARNWLVYHVSIGATQFLQLDTTIAALTGTTPWNDTAPTSSVVTLGTSAAGNESGVTRVAYCFSEVPGYSRFGSYTGNGSTDGPFVFCGFRPAYLLVKCSSTGSTDWTVYDATRSPYNVVGDVLVPNLSSAEFTGITGPDIVSNGFKLRDANSSRNSSGQTYIFAAFASAPQKFALAR